MTSTLYNSIKKSKDEGSSVKIGGLKALYYKLKGLSVVLYGEPGVGKTTLMVNLAKEAKKITGKPALYLALDANLRTKYGEDLKAISGADWREIDDLHIALNWIRGLRISEMEKYSLLVLDSFTAFQEWVILSERDIASPRVNLILSRLATIITMKFADIAHYAAIPAVMIVHPSAVFNPDYTIFRGMKPAFSGRAIKNVDLVLHMYVYKGEKRYLRTQLWRSIDKKPPFEIIDISSLV
ncbi:AAA family ATPase [Candidatus Woesearchaeota archaeon]|nr:AAA family ATPase [Candidatus Woesearchaeota archaeon]